jgi:hypothetical protein
MVFLVRLWATARVCRRSGAAEPITLPAAIGKKSKNRVLSDSVTSESSLPRCCASVFWWMTLRFVVFPPMPVP